MLVALVVMMLAFGKYAPRAQPWVQEDVKAIDMTPWTGAKYAGLGLLILVIGIYISFI
ncbi:MULTISPECIES: hypothetical protein [Halomonas]|uniref:hypothetical protein n=1 Tax=Halomonas TaxID=2745 RepID=UPI000A569501|nr:MULTISPECIES: hypothetical protein [Halomonas]